MKYTEIVNLASVISSGLLLIRFLLEIFIIFFKKYRLKNYKGRYVICKVWRDENEGFEDIFYINSMKYLTKNINDAKIYNNQYLAYKEIEKEKNIDDLFIKNI